MTSRRMIKKELRLKQDSYSERNRIIKIKEFFEQRNRKMKKIFFELQDSYSERYRKTKEIFELHNTIKACEKALRKIKEGRIKQDSYSERNRKIKEIFELRNTIKACKKALRKIKDKEEAKRLRFTNFIKNSSLSEISDFMNKGYRKMIPNRYANQLKQRLYENNFVEDDYALFMLNTALLIDLVRLLCMDPLWWELAKPRESRYIVRQICLIAEKPLSWLKSLKMETLSFNNGYYWKPMEDYTTYYYDNEGFIDWDATTSADLDACMAFGYQMDEVYECIEATYHSLSELLLFGSLENHREDLITKEYRFTKDQDILLLNNLLDKYYTFFNILNKKKL